MGGWLWDGSHIECYRGYTTQITCYLLAKWLSGRHDHHELKFSKTYDKDMREAFIYELLSLLLIIKSQI